MVNIVIIDAVEDIFNIFCLVQNQMRSIIPNLTIALKHLIKANQVNGVFIYIYKLTFVCIFSIRDKVDLMNCCVCLCLHRTKPVRPWKCLMNSWRVKCPSLSLILLILLASAWRWELNSGFTSWFYGSDFKSDSHTGNFL